MTASPEDAHQEIAPRVVVGAMTGTSMDGIDAAAVEIHGHGLAARGAVVSTASGPLGDGRLWLAQLARGVPIPAAELDHAAHDLSRRCGEIMVKALGGRRADLAIVHGQTVLHDPPRTWQVIDPDVVEALVRCPTATDLRRSDLNAGGQGAPITPMGDWVLFRTDRRRAVVNLGGFCNITWLSRQDDGPEGIHGADICPCNLLLDEIARRHLGRSMDIDGAAAASGAVLDGPCADLVFRLDALATQQRALGPGDEAHAWLDNMDLREAASADVAATAAAAIGRVIGRALSRWPCDGALLAGGGTHHRALVASIMAAADVPVGSTDDVGVPVEAREAACLACLAALERDGIAPTLPGVTQRRSDASVTFAWSSG